MEEKKETEEKDGRGGGGGDSQENRGGVRYITEELVLRLSGLQSLALVRSLNLSSSTGDRHIKFIENLHACQHLQVLNLNNNIIQRMERLTSLTQLRELHLAHNSIQRIEGLEHMSRLQYLNLSHNRIERVPLWLSRKLHALHTLHLQHNRIASLYDLSRLRSLSSLSELCVSENPASSLPHSRLFLLYHLRTLDRLDHLPITREERDHAHQRFHTGELQRLQREADSSQSELSRLRSERQAAATRLLQQEETNQTLSAQTHTQQHTHTLLEQELHAKSQLLFSGAFLSSSPSVVSSLLKPRPPVSLLGAVSQLKQKTAELTRACQRQYELEQELAFYKIDAKFSPLPYCAQEQEVDTVAESPYIGKALHTRNPVPSSSPCPSPSHSPSLCPSPSPSPVLQQAEQPSRPLLEAEAQARLLQLNSQIEEAEQQLAAELTLLHETRTHRQEALCRLHSKLSLLEELTAATDETHRQMDRQAEESRQTERETDELQTQLHTQLHTPHSSPAQQAHVTAQLANRRQLLATMSRKQRELEGRLDDMLSRIAMETQEIKELEQQLTDGQILANEALQRDLQGIISGLQEYLGGLRDQARRAQLQVDLLQADKQTLQRQLQDTHTHCRQLEDSARTHTQELQAAQQQLCVLQMQSAAQRDRQAESSRQQEELSRKLRLQQVECSALQEALDKERQARQNAETQLQSATDALQDEKSSLQQEVQNLQAQLDRTRAQLQQSRSQQEQSRSSMLDPQELQRGLQQLAELLLTGRDSFSPAGADERLRSCLQQLHTQIHHSRNTHTQSQEQSARLQAQLAHSQALLTQLNTQLVQEQEQVARLQAELVQEQEQQEQQEQQEEQRRLRSELLRLREKLQSSQTQSRHIQHSMEAELQQSRLQLQDVQQERDALLAQLRSERAGHQKTLGRLDRKLRQLSRFTRDSDRLTAEQIRAAADQLRALQGTVDTLDQLREQDNMDKREGSFLQAELERLEREREHTHTLQDEHTHTVEELGAEQHTHTHQVSSGAGGGDRGQWFYIPPGHSAFSLGSQGTQDSGLGLQYLSSPVRGRHRDRPPTGGGYWVCIPPTHTNSETAGWRDSGGGSEAGSSSRGSGGPGSPPAAAWLQCGCAAAGGAAPHCSVPEHRDQRGVCVCVHSETQRAAERLEEERKKLRLETKQLRHTLRRHRSVLLCDEVECVEKTLLKRRAELRQADRLLLEAQSCIHTARDKAGSVRQQQLEAEQVERGASCLLHVRLADLLSACEESQKRLECLNSQVQQQEQKLQQRREEEQSELHRLEELQRRRSRAEELCEQQEALLCDRSCTVSAVREEVQREEQSLLTLRSELSTHRAELKQVLEQLLAEQQALEGMKTKHTQSRQRLHRKQEELDRKQEELDGKQEEVTVLQAEVEFHRKEAEFCQKKAELRRAELQELEEESEQRKAGLLEETGRKRAELQEEIEQRRAELQEETQRRRAELQEESDRKRAELQEDSDRKRVELQQETNRKRAELGEESERLEEQLSSSRQQSGRLQQECKHLEARRRHAHRCLLAVEAELARQREEQSHAHLLKQEADRDTAATQAQLDENSELLSLLSEQVEERKKQLQALEQELCVSRQQQQQKAEQLEELHRQIEHKKEVEAAVTQMGDRGRHLTTQQLQLNQLNQELWEREKQLHQKEAELQRKQEELHHTEDKLSQRGEELQVQEAGLRLKEEGLHRKGAELHNKEKELLQKEEEQDSVSSLENREMSEEEEESFYLSTALRSAVSSEEQCWRAELQTEDLRQQEDQLKARLRCRLWSEQENLTLSRLEAEESLLDLKHRVEQLDTLLTHTH